ncbi:hypothetical protein F2Q69_00008057 [Brassica cretica]|uniref:Uncharacterized protein n=1 Tax=Brassica cretica TaxID=69181 RepID=A0A8S9P0Z9_BRACR|nr:hypothetical protein F2Q69_00008057 [Brassica cretica]
MDSGLSWADQWDYNSDPPSNSNKEDDKKKINEDGRWKQKQFGEGHTWLQMGQGTSQEI